MIWLWLGMSYFLLARSDEVFANGSGVVNPAHCLTRSDVAFLFLATDIRGVFNGVMPIGLRCDSAAIKASKLKLEASCTRSEVRGPCSELGEGGGAVALMVALLSCFAALPQHVPLSSYR